MMISLFVLLFVTPHTIDYKKKQQEIIIGPIMIIDIGMQIIFVWRQKNFQKKDIMVFGMGAYAEKEFKTKNPKIIDYVNSNLKSDFMDVFLGAKCSFCLSTSALGLMRFQILLETNYLFNTTFWAFSFFQ